MARFMKGLYVSCRNDARRGVLTVSLTAARLCLNLMRRLSMAKALVLGGATGLLGQALTRILTERGWSTTTLGRQQGDVLDDAFLAERLDAAQPDVVFNTIAWTQVDDAEDHAEEARLVNRCLPASLARLLQERTSALLMQYSTDFVFGGQHARPLKEDDKPHPHSVYGATKLEGEEAVRAALPERSCVLRTAWLFGHGRRNFVEAILDACHRRDEIRVVHDQTGSPSFADDVALYSALLAEAWLQKGEESGVPGIWHVTNSGEASWCELACEAVQLTSAPCRVIPITSAEWPQKAKRPEYSVLCTDKLAAFLGRQPRPWPQALRAYLFARKGE